MNNQYTLKEFNQWKADPVGYERYKSDSVYGSYEEWKQNSIKQQEEYDKMSLIKEQKNKPKKKNKQIELWIMSSDN